MSNSSLVLQKDDLNESWVDLHFKNGGNSDGSSSGQGSPKSENNIHQSGLYMPLNIEKLLQDAQRESNQNSREASARTSPKAMHSPTGLPTKESIGTDWMWDWSSGPEINQSKEKFAVKLQNAARERPRYTSVRKTSIFSRENLTALVASHLSVFVLGAVVMFIVLKKTGNSIPLTSRS